MYNKTIIEFGFRMICRIMEISEGCYLPRPTASTDNTLLDLHNSPCHGFRRHLDEYANP